MNNTLPRTNTLPAKLKSERPMPKWVTEANDRIGPKPPAPPSNTTNGSVSPRPPALPPKKNQAEPDYEVIEFTGQQYSNEPTLVMRPKTPDARRPESALKCTLCGSNNPWVTCDECAQQIFCASCDDMFHKHPKRKTHLRKAIELKRGSTPLIPPKAMNPPAPVAPPRRNKRGMPSPMPLRRDQVIGSAAPTMPTASPIPGQQQSWQDRLGSLKSGLSLGSRPLPETPRTPSDGVSSRSTTPNSRSVFDAIQRPPSLTLEKIKNKASATLDRMALLQQRYRQHKDAKSMDRTNGQVGGTRDPLLPSDQWSNISSPSHFRSGSMSSGINSFDFPDDSQFNFHQQMGMRNTPAARNMSSSVFNLNQVSHRPTNHQSQMWPGGNQMQQAQSMAQLNCINCSSHQTWNQPMQPDAWPGASNANLNRSNMSLNVPHGFYPNPHAQHMMHPPPVFMNMPGMYPYPMAMGMQPMSPMAMQSSARSRATSRAGSRAPPSPPLSRKSMQVRKKRSSYTENELTDDEDSDNDDRRSLMSQRSGVVNPRRGRRVSSASQALPLEEEEEPRTLRSKILTSRDRRGPSVPKSVQSEWTPARRPSTSSTANANFNSYKKVYSDSPISPDSEASEAPPTRVLVQAKIQEKLKESSKAKAKSVEQPVEQPESEADEQVELKTSPPELDDKPEEDQPMEVTAEDNSSLGPPPSTPDHEWECEFCTFVNEAKTKICSICCKTPQHAPAKHSTQQTASTSTKVTNGMAKLKVSQSEEDSEDHLAAAKKKDKASVEDIWATLDENIQAEASKAKRNAESNTSWKSRETRNKKASVSKEKISTGCGPSPPRETQKELRSTATSPVPQSIATQTYECVPKRRENDQEAAGTSADITINELQNQSYTPPTRHFSPKEIFPPMQDAVSSREAENFANLERSLRFYKDMSVPQGERYRSSNDIRLDEPQPKPSASDYLAMQKAQMYHNDNFFDQYAASKRNEPTRDPEIELFMMLKEAEHYKFTAEELHAALKHCGDTHPIVWLRENWSKLVQTVQGLATKYGQERIENVIGTISAIEAREALRMHGGNVWQAISECVEQRQRKYLDISAKGNYSREDIVTALTAHHGNVELALLDLSKSQLKPFLMRVWGSPGGVENESVNYMLPPPAPKTEISSPIHEFLNANAEQLTFPPDQAQFRNTSSVSNLSAHSYDEAYVSQNKNVLRDLENLISNMEQSQAKQNGQILRSMEDMLGNLLANKTLEAEPDVETERILIKSPIPMNRGESHRATDVKNFIWQHIQDINPILAEQVEKELLESQERDEAEQPAETDPIDQDEFLMEEVIKPNLKHSTVEDVPVIDMDEVEPVPNFQPDKDRCYERTHKDEVKMKSFSDAPRIVFDMAIAPEDETSEESSEQEEQSSTEEDSQEEMSSRGPQMNEVTTESEAKTEETKDKETENEKKAPSVEVRSKTEEIEDSAPSESGENISEPESKANKGFFKGFSLRIGLNSLRRNRRQRSRRSIKREKKIVEAVQSSSTQDVEDPKLLGNDKVKKDISTEKKDEEVKLPLQNEPVKAIIVQETQVSAKPSTSAQKPSQIPSPKASLNQTKQLGPNEGREKTENQRKVLNNEDTPVASGSSILNSEEQVPIAHRREENDEASNVAKVEPNEDKLDPSKNDRPDTEVKTSDQTLPQLTKNRKTKMKKKNLREERRGVSNNEQKPGSQPKEDPSILKAPPSNLPTSKVETSHDSNATKATSEENTKMTAKQAPDNEETIKEETRLNQSSGQAFNEKQTQDGPSLELVPNKLNEDKPGPSKSSSARTHSSKIKGKRQKEKEAEYVLEKRDHAPNELNEDKLKRTEIFSPENAATISSKQKHAKKEGTETDHVLNKHGRLQVNEDQTLSLPSEAEVKTIAEENSGTHIEENIIQNILKGNEKEESLQASNSFANDTAKNETPGTRSSNRKVSSTELSAKKKAVSKIPVRRATSSTSIKSIETVQTSVADEEESLPNDDEVFYDDVQSSSDEEADFYNIEDEHVDEPDLLPIEIVAARAEDETSDQELYSVASDELAPEDTRELMQSPTSETEVLLILDNEQNLQAPSPSSSTTIPGSSKSKDFKYSDSTKQNLSELVEDTQRLIKQMKEEINIDMAAFDSEDDYSEDYSYEEYDEEYEDEEDEEDSEENEEEESGNEEVYSNVELESTSDGAAKNEGSLRDEEEYIDIEAEEEHSQIISEHITDTQNLSFNALEFDSPRGSLTNPNALTNEDTNMVSEVLGSTPNDSTLSKEIIQSQTNETNQNSQSKESVQNPLDMEEFADRAGGSINREQEGNGIQVENKSSASDQLADRQNIVEDHIEKHVSPLNEEGKENVTRTSDFTGIHNVAQERSITPFAASKQSEETATLAKDRMSTARDAPTSDDRDIVSTKHNTNSKQSETTDSTEHEEYAEGEELSSYVNNKQIEEPSFSQEKPLTLPADLKKMRSTSQSLDINTPSSKSLVAPASEASSSSMDEKNIEDQNLPQEKAETQVADLHNTPNTQSLRQTTQASPSSSNNKQMEDQNPQTQKADMGNAPSKQSMKQASQASSSSMDSKEIEETIVAKENSSTQVGSLDDKSSSSQSLDIEVHATDNGERKAHFSTQIDIVLEKVSAEANNADTKDTTSSPASSKNKFSSRNTPSPSAPPVTTELAGEESLTMKANTSSKGLIPIPMKLENNKDQAHAVHDKISGDSIQQEDDNAPSTSHASSARKSPPKKSVSKIPTPNGKVKPTSIPTRSKSFSGPTPIGISSVRAIQQELFSKPSQLTKPSPSTQKPVPPKIVRKKSIVDAISRFTKVTAEHPVQRSRTQPKISKIPKKKYHETCFSDDDYQATSSEEEAPAPIEVRLRKQSAPVFRTYPSIQEPEIESPEILIRRFIEDSLVTNLAEAQIAAALVGLKFQEDVSIWAAKECCDLDQAISLLQQECELCMGSYPMNQIVSMLKCTHKCCKECAKNYFTIQITDRSINDCNCPFCKAPELHDPKVNEDENLEYFSNLDIFIKNIVDPEVHELFQRKLRDRTLMQDPNFKWCIQCSSGFFARPKQKRLICPDCGSVTCSQCRKTWEKQHEGLTCEKFQEWKDANDPEIQAKGVAEHLAINGIDCPKCRFKYSLARGGCMHFTCTQCKFEFCYGCSKPFMMGAKCTISPYCSKLGLHAHHPRTCLFYLRDKHPLQLQNLLKQNNVSFDVDPVGDDASASSKCPIPLQKETPKGLVDAVCNADVQENNAGLCRQHYVEYLAAKVSKAGIDPLPILDLTDCVQELRRRGLPLPERGPWDTDEIYRNMCSKVIKEKIPIS